MGDSARFDVVSNTVSHTKEAWASGGGMMKKRLFAAAAVGAFVAAAPAFADEGWYVRGAIGYGGPGDTDVSGSLNGEINGKGDWREAVALGYEWADGFRFEGELAHRYNDTGAVGNFENSQSDFQVWTAMANAIFDFNPDGTYHPYVGVGIGLAEVNGTLAGWTAGTTPIAPTPADYVVSQDSDNPFAWQIFAGIGWDISERWTLDTEYRYFSAGSSDFAPGVSVDALAGHEAWIGLRYSFAAPPPPPPPPPPPCDDVELAVYFGWDSADLTDQSRAVLAQAANEGGNGCNRVSVVLTGHTDRSGAASYNVGLSERRARVVRDELVRLGVSASMIRTEARGETDTQVSTADGVREPLNRRTVVEIDFE